MPQVKRKVINQKAVYEELQQIDDYFPKYHITILIGYLMQRKGGGIIPNRQFGMGVYIRIVQIMVLE